MAVYAGIWRCVGFVYSSFPSAAYMRQWTGTPLIPQVSILGALLFNVFVNDLLYFIQNCKLHNYADDNSLSMASTNLDTVLSILTHDGNDAIQ